jgi:hypothetical protein
MPTPVSVTEHLTQPGCNSQPQLQTLRFRLSRQQLDDFLRGAQPVECNVLYA